MEHRVPSFAGRRHISVLGLGVGRVEHDHIAVFVGVGLFEGLHQFVHGAVLAFGVAVKGKLACALKELLVHEHAVLGEHLDVLPLGLKVRAVVLEHLAQLVGDLLGDV